MFLLILKQAWTSFPLLTIWKKYNLSLWHLQGVGVKWGGGWLLATTQKCYMGFFKLQSPEFLIFECENFLSLPRSNFFSPQPILKPPLDLRIWMCVSVCVRVCVCVWKCVCFPELTLYKQRPIHIPRQTCVYLCLETQAIYIYLHQDLLLSELN